MRGQLVNSFSFAAHSALVVTQLCHLSMEAANKGDATGAEEDLTDIPDSVESDTCFRVSGPGYTVLGAGSQGPQGMCWTRAHTGEPGVGGSWGVQGLGSEARLVHGDSSLFGRSSLSRDGSSEGRTQGGT